MIGELSESSRPGAVSSITMPHKRNPETAEHLDTLARLARASSGVLVEGMVGGHERDGRSWKAEWVALPEVCQLTAAALAQCLQLLDGLTVHPAVMAATVDRFGGLSSERVLAGLATRLGKHRAQQVLHEALRGEGADPVTALVARGVATADEVRAWSTTGPVDAAVAMVDAVLSRAAVARAAEPARWGDLVR